MDRAIDKSKVREVDEPEEMDVAKARPCRELGGTTKRGWYSVNVIG